MTKPLSVTHPTAYEKLVHYGVTSHPGVVEALQSSTVDIGEHKSVLADYGKCVALCADAEAEVERLQKKLNNVTSNLTIWGKTIHEQGIVEGERRAMKIVKQVLMKYSSAPGSVVNFIWHDLGLDEVQQ